MRLRLIVLVVVALSVSAARTSAQTSAPSVTGISVSPPSGDIFSTHQVSIQGAARNSDVLIVIFDPAGGQTTARVQTDATGAARLALSPPPGGWQLGVYRAVEALGGGNAASAIFTAGDGGRHLLVAPALPSPNSAIEASGIGLPSNSAIRLIMTVAGGLGTREVMAKTDEQGSFFTLLWPQELGFDFFSAGTYQLSSPDVNLSTTFFIREHPSTSFISVVNPITPGEDVPLRLNAYVPGRYVWAVYATTGGHEVGEFLLGPVDERGAIATTVVFPALSSGTYLLSTPFDWGEIAFSVYAPTATATSTATPTSTDTPTATPTLTPTPTHTAKATLRKRATGHAKCTRVKHHRKRCKA